MTARSRECIDDGWRFHLGELDDPPRRLSAKGGECGGVADLVADERPEGAPESIFESLAETMPELLQVVASRPDTLGPGWREVHLPHDWRIEQPHRPDHPVHASYPLMMQGFLPVGVGYYRRRFAVPAASLGRHVFVEFDGVMRDSTVWCNGFFVGDHPSGYSSFRYELTDFLRYGDEGENVLLVRCDTNDAEGWWYEGAGIYRHVWLTTCHPVHIDHSGTWVTTPDVGDDRATVRVASTIRNAAGDPTDVQLVIRVLAPDGAEAATSTAHTAVAGDDTVELVHELSVASPVRWRPGAGVLYTVESTVKAGGDVVDRTDTRFGIRTIRFEPDGLRVNDERVLLQGANIHQDFAGVGVGLPDRIVEHKLELLAEMGCNAIRSSHHPPAPALLDAADRLGLLVVDEHRLLSSAPHQLQDLTATVRRDRNHPSVFAWSLENEETLQGTVRGERILATLARTVRRLDPTRPLTVGGTFNLESDHYWHLLDVIGMHYAAQRGNLASKRALRPDQPVMADEEGLYPTTRGQYEDDAQNGWCSAFGTTLGLYGALERLMIARGAPVTSSTFDIGAAWQTLANDPGLGGGFVWTGIDYFGEPTPMAWPVVGSSYGAIDICGFPKDYYWLLRSFFRSEPLVHILPHWTWPGRDGDPIRVWVYTNCDEVELCRNGEVVGRHAVRNHIAKWDDGVAYEPGTLSARGMVDGRAVAEAVVETVGAAHGLVLDPVRPFFAADGSDVAIVRVSVVDSAGRVAPHADHDVVFTVEGTGRLIGVGNGNPASHDPHQGSRRRAFRGRCLALIQADPDSRGVVELTATSEGLRAATLSIPID